jgi:hypothetical protein
MDKLKSPQYYRVNRNILLSIPLLSLKKILRFSENFSVRGLNFTGQARSDRGFFEWLVQMFEINGKR